MVPPDKGCGLSSENKTETTIRELNRDEVQTAINWAATEGWNPGHNDRDAFLSIDAGGFLGIFLRGEMIGCISAINYDETFSFLGFYIVKKEHQGKGYGLAVWKTAMAHTSVGGSARIIGLDGVVEQQPQYKKSGFQFVYKNIRFGGKPNIAAVAESEGGTSNIEIVHVQDFALQGLEAVIEYDRIYFPVERRPFLEKWLTEEGHTAKVAINSKGTVCGYAVLRPCQIGYKIGPLFADSANIAKQILHRLLVPLKGQEQLFIDVPEPNREGIEIAALLGLTKVFETARMYRGVPPAIDLDGVFGVTTFEVG